MESCGMNQLVLLRKSMLSIVKRTLHAVTTKCYHLTHVSSNFILKAYKRKNNSLLKKCNPTNLLKYYAVTFQLIILIKPCEFCAFCPQTIPHVCRSSHTNEIEDWRRICFQEHCPGFCSLLTDWSGLPCRNFK